MVEMIYNGAILHISPQLHILQHCIGRLKSLMVGVFTLWNLADCINQVFPRAKGLIFISTLTRKKEEDRGQRRKIIGVERKGEREGEKKMKKEMEEEGEGERDYYTFSIFYIALILSQVF